MSMYDISYEERKRQALERAYAKRDARQRREQAPAIQDDDKNF